MILSYHPVFVADKNIICAGRSPDAGDLAAIREADAVVLPQGCFAPLYEMVRNNCTHVFPNFDARFNYPGKIGQALLFSQLKAPHPYTETFLSLDHFYQQYGRNSRFTTLHLPFVFKFDWGGESDHVYLINTDDELKSVLQTTEKFERSGRTGFLIQEYIDCANRSLRVTVIGDTFISYWRVLGDPAGIGTSLARGATIDADSDPDLQQTAVSTVQHFCRQTKINLAGFDLLFASEPVSKKPYFLEINYFFGRRGLGNAEAFYQLLNIEILRWLDGLGLSLRPK
jgi:ribosomal protein S6--L-glutamate ligase